MAGQLLRRKAMRSRRYYGKHLSCHAVRMRRNGRSTKTITELVPTSTKTSPLVVAASCACSKPKDIKENVNAINSFKFFIIIRLIIDLLTHTKVLLFFIYLLIQIYIKFTLFTYVNCNKRRTLRLELDF